MTMHPVRLTRTTPPGARHLRLRDVVADPHPDRYGLLVVVATVETITPSGLLVEATCLPWVRENNPPESIARDATNTLG